MTTNWPLYSQRLKNRTCLDFELKTANKKPVFWPVFENRLPRPVEGCEFDLEEVPLDGFFMTLYDAAAELWRDAKEYFSQAANLLGDDFKMPGMWQQFWGAHQRFFKYLTMAAKVNKACQIARKAVRENQCVVIGLQSTGEQRTNEEMDRIMAEGEEINEMVSSCKGVFRRLLDTHFPVSDRDKLAELGINFDLPDSPDASSRLGSAT